MNVQYVSTNVEETVTTIEIDEETYEEIYKVSHAALVNTCKMSVLRIQQLNTYGKPFMF